MGLDRLGRIAHLQASQTSVALNHGSPEFIDLDAHGVRFELEGE